VLSAAVADPLAATRSLVAALLDVPQGTPPLLTPRVRRLASVSTTSPAHHTPVGTLGAPTLGAPTLRPGAL